MPDTFVSSQFNDPDSSPDIQQDINGDRNQVIGQMLGGIVINQLTIHDRVPAAAAPPPVSIALSLTQQEYRQRQVLLNKVKEYWVKGVLETSLHTRALIELGLQNRPDLVQRPFREVAEFPEVSGQALVEGTSATTVFEQMGAGRTLLILGEPGSGKTITLLKLAEDLIARSEKDLSQPIPVVFNLSSWAKKSQAIEHWLIQELLEKYQVSKALGKQWIETESLILLLDGLDEVKAEQRNACVQALNQFMQTHGMTELVICCRIQDYQALADRLMLRSSICIQPLISDQIDQYFEQAGKQLESLKEVLRQDEELQGLATSPLMLSIMSLAYRDFNPKDIIQGGTTDDYRQRLLDTYIDRMFQRRGTTQQYSQQKTQHWLIWLAQRLATAAQTVFLIERLQPGWLTNRGERLRYGLECGLIGGLFVGLLQGLLWDLMWRGLMQSSNERDFGQPTGLIIGTAIGGVWWAIIALASQRDIKIVETLKWSWQATKDSFYHGLRFGLLPGLIFGLIYFITLLISSLYFGWFHTFSWLISGLIGILFMSLSSSLMFGLFNGLLGGFRGPEIQHEGKPNQGIWRSARNAVILELISGLTVMVLFVWQGFSIPLGESFGRIIFFVSLGNGLMFGGMLGLFFGGLASFRHIALRLMLYRKGYSPWNYARFLDYAAERLFLQKVGGGYIFVHRMLMEHFAAMPLEQGRR